MTTVNDDFLVLELWATFNRLTTHDHSSFMSQHHSLVSEMALLHFIQDMITAEMKNIDIILEIIILCAELCKDSACANIMFEKHIITNLLNFWEDCGDDEEIQLHLLILCEKLLCFDETKSALLLSTGA
jgi:hypothetical protein